MYSIHHAANTRQLCREAYSHRSCVARHPRSGAREVQADNGSSINSRDPLNVSYRPVANGAVGYDLRPGVTAQLVVNNLFNTQYDDPGVGTANGLRFAASVPQPGRSLFVRVLARF